MMCLQTLEQCPMIINYRLDPTSYVSAPHLANNALLKTTGQEIELYTDQNMYNIMTNGIRGGISIVSNPHAIANNCYFYDKINMRGLLNYQNRRPKK